MGSHNSLAYCMLIKFSVAPESRSAVVLALFCNRWMNRHNCIDFCMEKYILSDPILLIQAAQIRPPKISLLSPQSSHQLFLVVFWERVQFLVDSVNGSGARITFVVFWTPIDELCGVHVGVFLFGGAIASEVSLFTTVKACTLYSSLESSVLDSSHISPLQTSSSASPIPSQCSGSIKIHWNWLIVP